ncbi:hypothetical protein Hdeb2414_s0014g00431061 [Helianthus debilis subsp. tardiflorus]
MILAVHCSYYIKSNRRWLSSYFMAHYLQTSFRRIVFFFFFLPSPLSRDSRALVSPPPHKTPSMFNHHSKSRETLDSISHRPCPLGLFEPSPTAIAPPSATKPGSNQLWFKGFDLKMVIVMDHLNNS